MFRINIPKLRGKMVEHNLSISQTAAAVGVSRNTMAKYLKCPRKMPFAVVEQLAHLLCDDAAEAAAIFFATDLRST